MAKDDLIDVQGTVVAVHSGGLYRVECDPGHEVLAQIYYLLDLSHFFHYKKYQKYERLHLFE